MLYETRNGAKCIPIPTSVLAKKDHEGKTYIPMQMLPAHPQRIEWVREDNLRRLDDEAQVS